MSEQQTADLDRSALIAELRDCYNIQPDDITFFPDDPRPFLSYEATCIMANRLMPDLRGIEIEPIESPFSDALSVRCVLTLPSGHTRSAVGVVNFNETLRGEPMGPLQLYQIASSRAIRNALRVASIDLLRLHYAAARAARASAEEAPAEPASADPLSSNRLNLLRAVHALGTEAGLIRRLAEGVADRTAWGAFLERRYGVRSSADLSDDLLADLMAALRPIVDAATAGPIMPARPVYSGSAH